MKTVSFYSKKWIIFSLVFLFFSCGKNQNNNTPDNLNNQNVGASAHDLLSAGKYTSLLIEIDYMPNYQPDVAAVNELKSFLSNLLNKPGGIQVTEKQITASADSTLSLSDIEKIESQNRTAYTSGSQIAVYYLCADADYNVSGVLGVSYKNTSICIFSKTIDDNTGGIGQANRTAVEATVLEHEFGHIMGLVNLGTPMVTPHQDTAHGNHCDNKNCLMYYATETTDLFGFLGGSVPSLDANCLADLKANGGK